MQLDHLEACPTLHKLGMGNIQEALDWKAWSAAAGVSNPTVQQPAKIERNTNDRPEYVQLKRLTQWRDCVAGSIPPELALGLSPVSSPPPTVSSPPAASSPQPTSPTPSMKLGIRSCLTRQLGITPLVQVLSHLTSQCKWAQSIPISLCKWAQSIPISR